MPFPIWGEGVPVRWRLEARSDEEPRWREALRELHFSIGAVATLYSAAAAENLSGPEHHVACATNWRNGRAAMRRGTIWSWGCGWAKRRGR